MDTVARWGVDAATGGLNDAATTVDVEMDTAVEVEIVVAAAGGNSSSYYLVLPSLYKKYFNIHHLILIRIKLFLLIST